MKDSLNLLQETYLKEIALSPKYGGMDDSYANVDDVTTRVKGTLAAIHELYPISHDKTHTTDYGYYIMTDHALVYIDEKEDILALGLPYYEKHDDAYIALIKTLKTLIKHLDYHKAIGPGNTPFLYVYLPLEDKSIRTAYQPLATFVARIEAAM